MSGFRILPGEAPRPGTCVFERGFASRVDLKQEVLDAIAGVLTERGLVSEDDHPWLMLCLDEAVVNAMLHGNEGDAAASIEVAVLVDDQRWTVIVADQGSGFAADAVPDGEDPQSLLLEHGRGIRILAEWLDELTYYRSGATVLMARRRADRPVPGRAADFHA